MSEPEFSLYILSCSDGSLYTGIASDVKNRIREHESGSRGAKYLRGRAPFSLVYEQTIGDRSAAQRLEQQVKQLDRAQKLDLIAGRMSLDFVSNH